MSDIYDYLELLSKKQASQIYHQPFEPFLTDYDLKHGGWHEDEEDDEVFIR